MTDKTPILREVTLDTPILRGEIKIDKVQLRRPTAGELRGLTMADLARLDVTAMLKLIPRITVPTLNEAELAKMPAEDLFALSTEIGSFLLQKADLADFPKA